MSVCVFVCIRVVHGLYGKCVKSFFSSLRVTFCVPFGPKTNWFSDEKKNFSTQIIRGDPVGFGLITFSTSIGSFCGLRQTFSSLNFLSKTYLCLFLGVNG